MLLLHLKDIQDLPHVPLCQTHQRLLAFLIDVNLSQCHLKWELTKQIKFVKDTFSSLQTCSSLGKICSFPKGPNRNLDARLNPQMSNILPREKKNL